MKIYEIGTGYTPIPAQMGAATEIVVEELTKAFLRKNEDVALLDIKAAERFPNCLPIDEVFVPSMFSGTDVKLGILHKLKRVVYSVFLAGKLRTILKQSEKPVLLHFHNQYNMYFFLKLTGKKLRRKAVTAYTVHSYIWPDEWEKIEKTVRRRYFQEITCVQNADLVLVLNDKTAEHFVNHLSVDPTKIHKIGNGVNIDVYKMLEQKQMDDFRRELGLENRHLIFQVGSVCDRKNQFGAVKMLRSYLQEHPDVVYMYAGGVIDQEYQENLQAYAKENGIEDQVRYMGELAPGVNLNRYYNAADVTIFPSKIESFGLVIIESIAAGTPVILFDQPLFSLDKGYTVCSSEPDFLEQIHKYVYSGMKGQTIRKEVCAAYSWDQIATDHLKIWKSV